VSPSEPYTEAQLKSICKAALDHGTVTISKHAGERMQECGLNTNDVRNTLIAGSLFNFDPGHGGSYKYRMTTRKIDAVVVVVGPDHIILVTAFRRDKP